MDNQQERLAISQFDLGWLIGIFDGEGSFWMASCKSKGYEGFMPVFEISNTNFQIMDRVEELLKDLNIPFHCYIPKRNSKQKEYRKLEVKGIKRLKRFFDILYPYFDCRFEQASLLKSFIDLRLSKKSNEPYTDNEHSIYYQLRQRNKRGC